MINHEDEERSPLIGKTVDVEDEGRGKIIAHHGDYVSIEISGDDYLGTQSKIIRTHCATLTPNEEIL